MTPHSLGWRTDLALLRQSGTTVEDLGDHLRVRTPDNPTFHWGNYLLLRDAPAPGDGARWVAAFEAAFPGATHLSIGVDLPHGSTGDLTPLAEAGLDTDVSTVLTCPPLAPTVARHDVEVRPLLDDADWEERIALSMLRYPREEATHDEFVRRRAAGERRRVEAGHGTWWGAFDGPRLLSTAGIFHAGDGLARYQDVETHPDAERRGLASAVLTAASTWAARTGATTLVIVADPDAGAVRLYRRLGFADTELQVAAYRA